MKIFYNFFQHSILALVVLSFAFLSCEELENDVDKKEFDTTFVFDTTVVFDTILIFDTTTHIDSTELWLIDLWDIVLEDLSTYDIAGNFIDSLHEVDHYVLELDSPTSENWFTVEFKEPGFTDPLPRYETRFYDDNQVKTEHGVWFANEDSLFIHDDVNPDPNDTLDTPDIFRYFFIAGSSPDVSDTLILEFKSELGEGAGGDGTYDYDFIKLARRKN